MTEFRSGDPIPEGASRVYLRVGDTEPTEIGFVQDLSYLPDVLENTAQTLRQMMMDQYMRHEAEKLVRSLQDGG